MILRNIAVLCFLLLTPVAQSKLKDWLINDINTPSQLIVNEADGSLTLTNGLISRTFSRNPGFTTIDYYSHEKKTSLFRALSPEAVVQLDNIIYYVGNVNANITRSYLNRTALAENIREDMASFKYTGHTRRKPEAPYPYKPMRGAPNDIVWPPAGLRLDVNFTAPDIPGLPATHSGVTITVHYEIYDGIPAMAKWVSVHAPQKKTAQSKKFSLSSKPAPTSKPAPFSKPAPSSKSATTETTHVQATIVSVEILAVNEDFSKISTFDGWNPPVDVPDNAYDFMYVESNKAHGTKVDWLIDPSQQLSPGSYQPLLNVTYTEPTPSILLVTGDSFNSFKVYELIHCASDSTRKALAVHRLHRLLQPQIQENPIFFHMTNSSREAFRATVDQLTEVGFEMIIYSFGSGFNFESDNETYIQQFKEDVEYANSKGIEVILCTNNALFK